MAGGERLFFHRGSKRKWGRTKSGNLWLTRQISRDLFTVRRIAEEGQAPVIQLPRPGSLPQYVGILGDTIRVEILVGTHANHITPVTRSFTTIIKYYVLYIIACAIFSCNWGVSRFVYTNISTSRWVMHCAMMARMATSSANKRNFQLCYNQMGPASFMQFFIDRNVAMRCMTVVGLHQLKNMIQRP